MKMLSVLLFLVQGCFPYYGPPTAGEDADTPQDSGSHGPPRLGSDHPGWRNPQCWSCHTPDSHNDGLDPYECASCHGTDGAPSGHGGDPPCADCHGQVHGAEGFPDPESCQTCHGG